mgnify:FL=1
MNDTASRLHRDLSSCSLCADRFAGTASRHAPRPVVWFDDSARILIAGQAPGTKVHQSGIPFQDRSGDRLRGWLGIDRETFYDTSRIAIVPMAFCFPGHSQSGSDLPPPAICARTWRARILDQLGKPDLTLLIGGYAQKWHLGAQNAANVTDTVANWRQLLPDAIPLPHPSWRNTGWLKKHPWFETDLLPVLRARVQKALK